MLNFYEKYVIKRHICTLLKAFNVPFCHNLGQLYLKQLQKDGIIINKDPKLTWEVIYTPKTEEKP